MENEISIDPTDMYSKCKEFWSKSESSVKGVLNGNDEVHASDVKTSCEFLEGLIQNNKLNPFRVIDCGAGIGRITNSVLVNYFKECDIVEQDQKFIDHCKTQFNDETRVKDIYCSPLQIFEFSKQYDVIWIQWCLENLEDQDLINFLIKCKTSLAHGGCIIIKENIVNKGVQFSSQDYSKVRSDVKFRDLFERSGLSIVKHFHHPNWPKDLLKVSVFLLK